MTGAVLQRCTVCGTAQYPPRACCHVCLSDRLERQEFDAAPGVLLARTVLHHSNEPHFRPRLPLGVGLVRLDAGPIVVCFVPKPHAIGDRVTVTARPDESGATLLEAG
jgi:uncharacterized OB-fold protein